MKTKTSKIIITIIALAIPSISYSQIDKASAMQAINEFKVEESSDKLQQCINKIEREPSLSDSSRAELLVQVLAASVEYLEKHPKPAETPQINVAPPDDSIAGADPASIKDPAVRAQYEKDIAANKALAETHRKHEAITAISDKLTTYCVSFSNIKPDNKKLLSDFLKVASSNPETVKTVAALIEKEEANKTQQHNR
jgi:hypothetical protein